MEKTERRILATALLFLCLVTQLMAADIAFADANVKALCVASWDTDNDGELSEEEAAAVLSLEKVFRANKTITTFDELAYFTGLKAINDYAFYQSSISHVTFPPTVMSIGEYAFSESDIGPEVTIPGNVKALKSYCFNSCQKLKKVMLEEGVESIGYGAFSGPIEYLSLPATLKEISSMAINPYVNAYPGTGVFIPKGDLTVQVFSEKPAPISNYAFYYVFAEGHLIVPYGCADVYKAVSGWSHFGEYIGMGDVNRDGKVNIADIACLIAYITGDEPSHFFSQAADVNGDGDIDAEDIEVLREFVLE